MTDPHVQQAYRAAVQYAVHDDPERTAEMIQRIRTLDRHGSVPPSELAVLAVVAAVRARRRSGLESSLAALGERDAAVSRRLREYLLAAPEASQPGFREFVEQLTASPVAAKVHAVRRAGGRAVVVAGAILVLLVVGVGGFLVGGRAGLWPTPRWMDARAERPEEALREWIIDLVTLDLVAAWDRLPSSWRSDADESLERLRGSIDPKVLAAAKDLLETQADLLESKRAFIEPEVPEAFWFAVGVDDYDGLIAGCRSLSAGPLLDPGMLGSISARDLLQALSGSAYARTALGPILADQLMEDLEISAATLVRPDVREHLRARIGVVVQSEGDSLASVRLVFPRGEEVVFDMMLEEGRWISEALARDWEDLIAWIRRLSIEVRTRSGETEIDKLVSVMTTQREELERLKTAKTKEEFDAMVTQLPVRIMMRQAWW